MAGVVTIERERHRGGNGDAGKQSMSTSGWDEVRQSGEEQGRLDEVQECQGARRAEEGTKRVA